MFTTGKLLQLFTETSRAFSRSPLNQLQLSAPAFYCILKLARTIADLTGSESILPAHRA